MKPHLLFPDRDFDPAAPLPWAEPALTTDLGLDTLFTAMAGGDDFVLDMARKAVLLGCGNNPETILYRQAVLKDCLRRPAAIRELYALAAAAVDEERKHYLGSLSRYPEWVLSRSVELLAALFGMIQKLRAFADAHAGTFDSDGWRTLVNTLQRELSEEYLEIVRQHLDRLKFRNGVLLSAELGPGNKGVNYVLRAPPAARESWLARMFSGRPRQAGFSIDPRDESGGNALQQLRAQGVGSAASAVAQAADHVRSFFAMLKAELAVYLGALNLHETLMRKGEPVAFPTPFAAGERRLSFRGLYDVTLALRSGRRVVGNEANADGRSLIVVTGANQGGKSTFLRSIGLAQLMMQAGLFAPAEALDASVCDGLFTHYKREEDAGMESGKLDEELARMSAIVDHLTPNPLILFNESFAATNEREGSEVARQILAALIQTKAQIVCVTHLFTLARGFYDRKAGDVLFLRAERRADGGRTFKLIEGEPLQTSFGEDLYRTIFTDAGAGREHAIQTA